MSIRIRNIRLGKETTKISYDIRTNDEQWIHHTIESPEMPLEEFKNSLQILAEDVCCINEFYESDSVDMTVNGITFSYKDSMEDYKVVILAKRPVKLSNSPRNTPTPLVDMGGLNEDDENYEFKKSLKEKLANVQYYAERYINGDREKPERMSLYDNNSVEDKEEVA